MSNDKLHNIPESALIATDQFYRSSEGFGYDLTKLIKWLTSYTRIPETGKILDLCCGDGIWSQAFKELNPELDCFGIDISAGGVERAKERVKDSNDQFVVGDVEVELPFPKKYFNFIFARGAGIYNQHDMSRRATVKVIEMWHEYLVDGGVFCGVYGSTPSMMGSYTPIEKVKLPYNKVPRHSPVIQFEGGKFHHSIESFHAPFLAAKGIEIINYSFNKNKHIIHTRRKL